MYKLPSWHSHVKKSLFNLKFAFENRPVSDAPRLAILYSGKIPGIVPWQGNRNRLWVGNNKHRALSWPLLHLPPLNPDLSLSRPVTVQHGTWTVVSPVLGPVYDSDFSWTYLDQYCDWLLVQCPEQQFQYYRGQYVLVFFWHVEEMLY